MPRCVRIPDDELNGAAVRDTATIMLWGTWLLWGMEPPLSIKTQIELRTFLATSKIVNPSNTYCVSTLWKYRDSTVNSQAWSLHSWGLLGGVSNQTITDQGLEP